MPRHPKRFAEDGTELKFCGSCEEWKPKTLEFFYFRKSRGYFENPCRECAREYARRYAAENPVDLDRQWAYQIKSQYGITVEDYWEMFERQGGGCNVCGEPPQAPRRHLSIDHCHVTGVVRGLLCYKCNTAAGLLDDDPEKAAALVTHLLGG